MKFIEKKQLWSIKLKYYSLFLSILVVYTHAINKSVYTLDKTDFYSSFILNFENFFGIIFLISVPSFYIISGFLFFYKLKTITLTEKIKKRIKTLVIPYIIWNTLGFCFFSVLGKVEFSLSKYIEGLVTSEYTALWFVKSLFLIVMITPLIYYLIQKKIRGMIFIGVLIVSNFILEANHFSMIYGLILFSLGGWIGIHFKGFFTKIYEKKIVISSLIIFLLMTIVFFITNLLSIPGIRVILISLYCIVSWIGFDIFNFNNEPKWWINLSFYIYCLHPFILEPVEKIWLIMIGDNYFGAITDFLFAPVITIVIIYATSYILKKYCYRVWGLLNGSRG